MLQHTASRNLSNPSCGLHPDTSSRLSIACSFPEIKKALQMLAGSGYGHVHVCCIRNMHAKCVCDKWGGVAPSCPFSTPCTTHNTTPLLHSLHTTTIALSIPDSHSRHSLVACIPARPPALFLPSHLQSLSTPLFPLHLFVVDSSSLSSTLALTHTLSLSHTHYPSLPFSPPSSSASTHSAPVSVLNGHEASPAR